MTQTQAFTEALILALLALNDEQSRKAISLAIDLSHGLTPETVTECKENALKAVRGEN